MKTEVKAIIASVVVIALCLAAVGGVTYSWFSDSEQADVNITAGDIQLDMEMTDLTVRSYNGSEKEISDNSEEPTITDLNGEVYYTTSSTSTSSTSTTTVEIVFNGAAPGDVLEFNVSGTLKNTINVYYAESSTIESTNGATSMPFTIKGLNESVTFCKAINNTDGTNLSSKTVSISMDTSATEMGKNYTITILFRAYQANAPVPSNEIVSTITEGENNLIVYPTSGTEESAGISFNQTGSSEETLTVTAIDSSDSGYTVSENQILLTGIDVASSTEESALKGTPTTVTFRVFGDYSKETLTFYHDGETFTPSVPATISYDSSTQMTTISFVTTDGFSAYYVSVSPVAMIGDTGYALLEYAIDAAQNNETITLSKDCTIYNSVTISGTKTINIALGTYTITSDATKMIWVRDGATLNISGENGSSINSSGSPIHLVFGGTATISNTTIIEGDSIYVSTTSFTNAEGKTVSATTDNYTWIDTLTLDNVTINSKMGAICGYTNSKITITECEINDTAGGGLITNGTINMGSQNWTITDTVFDVTAGDNTDGIAVTSVGIQAHNSGNWTITRCTFNMDSGVAVSVRGGNVTISDCQYNFRNVFGNATEGYLQFTDVAIFVETEHAVAVWYKDNSYGYTNGNATLSIDGESITSVVEGTMKYFEFEGQTEMTTT